MFTRKRITHIRILVALFVTLFLALFLSACTQAEPEQVVVTQVVEREVEVTRIVEGTPVVETVVEEVTRVVETTATPEAVEEADTEPRTLFIADIIDIAPIDPATYSHTIGRTMIRNVYDPLVYYELGGYTVEPRLATSWEASEDGLEYTFQLRDDVSFHNGDPFTAEDVKVTFDRVAAIGENVAPASLGGSVESVEVIDDYTVKFTLNFPYAFFVDVLPKIPILNAEDVEAHRTDDDPWAHEWFLNNGNGTGPYMFAEWTPGEGYTLLRNEEWFGGFHEFAYDRVVMRVINDGAQQRQLLERGELDIVSDWIAAIDKIDAANSSDQVKLVDSGGLMVLELIIHGTREETEDNLVRQALFWAFPYEEFMGFYQGYAELPTGVFDQDYPGVKQYEPLHQDLDRARELLAEAGFPDGGFTLQYDYDQGSEEKNQAALLYQAALAELGIELQINPVPGPTWFEKGRNEETAAHFNPHYEAPETPDPFQWIQKMFGPEGYLNWHHRSTPELAAIIEEAQVTADPDQRVEMLHQAQDIIREEGMAIPISNFSIIHPQNVCVQGFIFDPLDLQGVPKFWPLYEDPACAVD